jgi:hypothetical protein
MASLLNAYAALQQNEGIISPPAGTKPQVIDIRVVLELPGRQVVAQYAQWQCALCTRLTFSVHMYPG